MYTAICLTLIHIWVFIIVLLYFYHTTKVKQSFISWMDSLLDIIVWIYSAMLLTIIVVDILDRLMSYTCSFISSFLN